MEDVTAKTDYDTIGGTENVLKYVDAKTGEAKALMPASRAQGAPAALVGRRAMVCVCEEGRGVRAGGRRRERAQPDAEAEGRRRCEEGRERDGGERVPRRTARTRRRKNRSARVVQPRRPKLLVTSRKGWYVVTVADAARQLILPLDEDEEKNPRVAAIDWTPDGTGIYATWGARDAMAARHRADRRRDAAMTTDRQGRRLYGGVRLSRDGSTFVFTMSDGDRPAELHAADTALLHSSRG